MLRIVDIHNQPHSERGLPMSSVRKGLRNARYGLLLIVTTLALATFGDSPAGAQSCTAGNCVTCSLYYGCVQVNYNASCQCNGGGPGSCAAWWPCSISGGGGGEPCGWSTPCYPTP